jgi:argininosuccinate lyase
MENTGRITRGLTPTARRIVFGGGAGQDLGGELPWIAEVDRAHLVMLVERGLVDRVRAADLLRTIAGLEAASFAPLAGRPAMRGAYILYEDFLIETLGADTGGVLQTGRSRNDLNATVLRLRLRAPWLRLLRELIRLQATLLGRARRHADVTMPLFTHFQAALPSTWGHYLAGIAAALARDLEALAVLGEALDECPLGAGAAGGTTLPIDPARTAALLGFAQPVAHSLDAVASRDVVLRLLAAAAVLGVTLSRAATDLLIWNSSPFGFLAFPDRLVGSSSMMPQKRNAFLLEHVQGKGAALLGAFTAATSAMQAKPFTNSIAVGTEGVAPLWDALVAATDAVVLLRLTVAGAEPQREAMLRQAASSYTTATELANRLVAAGLPFRTAHRIVGTLVREALAAGGEPLENATRRWAAREGISIDLSGLDPSTVARSSEHGGGPGPQSFRRCLDKTREHLRRLETQVRQRADGWAKARVDLAIAVGRLEEGIPRELHGSGRR